MTLKKIVLLFCMLCPIVIGSCGEGQVIVTISYTFDNQSSFAVQITLSEPYTLESPNTTQKPPSTDNTAETEDSAETDKPPEISKPPETEEPSKPEIQTSPFLVDAGSKKTVYVKKSDVGFQWTTDSAGNNPKVYCTINGARATFGNR